MSDSEYTSTQKLELKEFFESIPEAIVVLGYPEVKELRGLTVTEGIISNLFYTKKEFRVSAEVTSGTSGSPVLNGEGKVIGIATASPAQPDVVTFRGKRVICCRFSHRATNMALHRKEILTFIEQDRKRSKKH